jgi:hypothetical protein
LDDKGLNIFKAPYKINWNSKLVLHSCQIILIYNLQIHIDELSF